ncbi:MAG: anti-sigma factor antagonist [Clostridia bacterium]|nr:anti-sigma factor antagonist [Clostridia bacterium]
MTILYNSSPETLNVKLSGEIDHHSAKTAREEIDKKYKKDGCKNITLDMSAITFCDSSGLGLIMGRYRTVKEYGGELFVKNPASVVEKMIRLSGMDKLINVVE